jgi:hypothetical protein
LAAKCFELHLKKKKMVSLVEKITYLKEFEDKPKIQGFIQLLNGKNYKSFVPDQSGNDELYYSLLNALITQNKTAFIEAYDDISKRVPNSDSVWITENFLIFILILGVVKFQIDKEWINGVLTLRDSRNETFQKTNQTFKNLLSENFTNTDAVTEIVIVFLDFQNLPQLHKELLDKTYLHLSNQTNLLDQHNDFLTVISLRSFDIIVTTKDTPDASEIVEIRAFRSEFLKRIEILNNVLYGVLILTVIVLMYKAYKENPTFKYFLNDLGVILSIIGVALLAGFNKIRQWMKILLLKGFGYSKHIKE